jgi:hypothetical protein
MFFFTRGRRQIPVSETSFQMKIQRVGNVRKINIYLLILYYTNITSLIPRLSLIEFISRCVIYFMIGLGKYLRERKMSGIGIHKIYI